MLQVDLVQSLFERAGGAKEAGQSKTSTLRRRRSKFGVSGAITQLTLCMSVCHMCL